MCARFTALNLAQSARFRAVNLEISLKTKKNTVELPTRRESGALAIRLVFFLVLHEIESGYARLYLGISLIFCTTAKPNASR